MKGIFKLTTAALALVAFASCSNNDLFGEAQQVQQQAKGDILVEVEELEDAVTTRTRAAYTPDGKTGILNWNTGDNIKVTDGTLVKYDAYTFENGAFKFDKTITGRNAAWIAEPEYASFGHNYSTSDGLVKMEWDNAKKQAKGYYVIDKVLSWDEDWETEGAFCADIPLWGTAQADDTYGVKVSMKYLTGVLKINMDNVPGNATGLKIEGFKNLAGTDPAPINGDFKAILANDDEINTDAALVVDEDGWQGNELYVDLSNATKAKSVIFVPLIAQTYGLLNISYTNTDFVGASSTVDDPANVWTAIKSVENLTVARKKYYNLTYSTFKVSGDTPSAISAVLNEKKAESDISIETGNNTKVATADQTIDVPATSSNITLNLKGVEANGANVLKINGAGYTGTITINVKTNDTTNPIANIFVNLPKANVVIAGAGMTNISLGADAAPDNAANGLVAKTLTIGTAAINTTVANVYANAELGLGNATESDLLLVKGSTITGNLEFETNYKADLIEINGTLTNALDMSAWTTKDGDKITSSFLIGNGANTNDIYTYGDVTVTGGTVKNIVTDGDVKLSGVTNATAGTTAASVGTIYPLSAPAAAADAINKTVTVDEEATVNGNITEKTNNKFNLIVKGKASVTGGAATSVKDLTINGTSASVGTVKVAGDATITDTDECEAVKTSLTMTAGNTLNYNGGYIRAITVTAVTDKKLTIKHGTAANYTAIAAITGDYTIDTTTKSEWNGHAIGEYEATAPAAFKTAQDALKAAYATGVDNIYTANQLASFAADAAATLYSNIDLNGKAWTSPSLAVNFTGKNWGTAVAPVYPTIEGLNLAANAKAANIAGVGLFGRTTAAAVISNINVKNVTSTITEDGKDVTMVGTLVGMANNTLGITNVTVSTANVGSLVAEYIGGLVGVAYDDLTLDGVTVTGLTLNGEARIGGVTAEIASSKAITIGTTAATNINVTAINVPASYNAEPDIKKVAENKIQYGCIGMVVGKANNAAAIVSNNKLTINDLITGNRQKLGFKFFYMHAGPTVKYYYGLRGDDHTKEHTWIGYNAAATIKEFDKVADFTAEYKNPSNAIMLQHDIYDDCDK